MDILIKKYAPKSIHDIVGHKKEITQIINFIKDFKKQKKKAILLYGPPGTGKSSSVYAIANQFNYEVVEVNASDFRSKDNINKKIGNAIKQQSLLFENKIILVDEVDGLSGTKDRGAIPALVELIKKTNFPIIITANDPWDQKFNPLRRVSTLIEFKPLTYLEVFKVLEGICKRLGISYEEEALKSLARFSGGDLRAALNDLELLSTYKKITKEEIKLLDERHQTESIFNALIKVFRSNSLDISITAFDDVDEDYDKIFLWIEENLPKEYYSRDLLNAFDSLSKADVYNGRIRRWQYWRFLVYIRVLLTAGVALAKTRKKQGYVKYDPPKRILKIWIANNKLKKRLGIAEKIAEHTHTSKKRILDNFNIIREFLKKYDQDLLIDHLNLTEEEVKWIKS